MQSDYVVRLITDNEALEPFEIDGDNVASVKILTGTTKNRVMITLSRNALLGLGTELIRLAHRFEVGYHTHMSPVDEHLVSQNMGVFLTADSTEVILSCTEFGQIENYLK